jgi:capsule biosynthesis phosphatase
MTTSCCKFKKIIIIPLGGLGNRFKNAGYNLPKPLINVMGKPIIYWLLENLDLSDIEYVYIPYNKELKKYRFEDLLVKDFKNMRFKFFCLENNTRGAAETIKISLEYLKATKLLDNDDKHVMCIDNDNFFTENIAKYWDGNNLVLSFHDDFNEPIFSYVKLENDDILDIREKYKISDNACCGVYAFNSLHELLEACNYIVDNNIREKDEFYISGVIKHMITQNHSFCNKTINKNNYHCLGTPLQVKIFCNNFDNLCQKLNRNLLTLKRYCFDLDNTLVTFPKVKNDYKTVEPIVQNIEMLRNLKKMGHTIIIYTARRMQTHNGNIGKILADIARITLDTLEKFDIPYDEIYFGKPNADYYIDDLAISSYDNLEKALGFYKINIEPRDFNTIESSNFETIRKSSKNLERDLEGEICYYKTIQQLKNNAIKDLFPILVNFDQENKWYQVEKINGISISKLYLAEELNINLLKKIIDSVMNIQNSQCWENDKNNNFNIYDNYSKKLKERYEKYDYSIFNKSNELYNNLIDKLNYYEEKNKGKIKVIHGDPVFTNIILDKYNKLKFIDMRGKVGDKLTIFGDWLYDWAKLYQSLIGYDEILDDVDLDISYKNILVNFFREEFIKNNSIEDFGNLQLITKSLLFSLIPLHHDKKCERYYNLIFSTYLNQE